jgi:hypothetical protein
MFNGRRKNIVNDIEADLAIANSKIKQLEQQIASAKRDIQLAAEGVICDICMHSGEDAGDKNSACWNCTQGNCKFEWRGPQEAGEGDNGG